MSKPKPLEYVCIKWSIECRPDCEKKYRFKATVTWGADILHESGDIKDFDIFEEEEVFPQLEYAKDWIDKQL